MPRRKMTEEQREKDAERLRIAREKRLRENPPKYANIHPSVLAKPDDHPLSRKNVVSWIKTQKSLLTSERGKCEKKCQRSYNESRFSSRIYSSYGNLSKRW